MLYMIVEHFHNGDPLPVYRRFRDQGRLAPAGLKYVASWVTEDFRHCFQVMECDDRKLLGQRISRRDDIVDFEIMRVMTLAYAASAIFPRLGGRLHIVTDSAL